MLTKRARTISATTDALKTTCEIRTVQSPSGDSMSIQSPTCTKKIRAEMPKTISGVTSVI